MGGLESVAKKLTKIQRLVIVACGTSYYSGLIGKQYFEEFAGIPTTVEYASEFRYGACSVDKKTAVIAISQSGETADTLEALRVAKKHGALTLGVVNVVGSTIARESDAGVYSHAGPEIGVASTKAFIAQIGVMLLMALFFAEERKVDVDFETIAREAKALPSKIKKTLDLDEAIHALAKRSISNEAFLYVGRKYQFPVAMEGALKLKEISYRHAEGYAAGEMKHGPIALIERGFPVLVLAPQDSVYEKMISNIQELKAREAWVIAIATYGDATIKQMADEILYIPKTIEVLGPLLSVIPLQLFAYHTAALLGLDVDKPRNLAKSVTVE